MVPSGQSGSFASESELLRFKNEAETVAQLDHPHIVPVYEVVQHGGRHFFTMKLVEGRTLAELLDARTSLADRLPRPASQGAVLHDLPQGLRDALAQQVVVRSEIAGAGSVRLVAGR